MISIKSRIGAVALGVLGVCGMLTASPALAAIISLTASPASTGVPLGGSTSVVITWSATTTTGTFVSSPNGTFVAPNGAVLATVPTTLYQPATIIGTLPVTVTATEAVLVPTAVIYRAYKLGFGSFTYTRTFTDSTGIAAPQSVTMNITTSSASGFGLAGMSLSFDDGKVVRLLDRNEKLSAQAEVNFTGTGLFQGVWEVADPTSTAGQPIFRPLELVRRYLAGSGAQIIQSPILPTDLSGLYIIRLRVTDPVPGFDQPFLRYFVLSGKPGEIRPILPIGLVTPAHKALLAANTVFAWEPVRDARAYQIEMYARAMTLADQLPSLGSDRGAVSQKLPDTPPVTGMLVAGTQTQTTLSAAARSHLQRGKIYLWRVLAIAKDGSIVGQSSVREIRLP